MKSTRRLAGFLTLIVAVGLLSMVGARDNVQPPRDAIESVEIARERSPNGRGAHEEAGSWRAKFAV